MSWPSYFSIHWLTLKLICVLHKSMLGYLFPSWNAELEFLFNSNTLNVLHSFFLFSCLSNSSYKTISKFQMVMITKITTTRIPLTTPNLTSPSWSTPSSRATTSTTTAWLTTQSISQPRSSWERTDSGRESRCKCDDDIPTWRKSAHFSHHTTQDINMFDDGSYYQHCPTPQDWCQCYTHYYFST